MSIIIQDNIYSIPLCFNTCFLVFVLKEFLFQLFFAENLQEKSHSSLEQLKRLCRFNAGREIVIKDMLGSVVGRRLMPGAGLSPAQADLLRAVHAASGACMGKPQLLHLETPYLELGCKSQSILGTFCFFIGKWDAAGHCVIPS